MKFSPRNYLTAGQQKVLCVALFLLLVGLTVKVWRTRHPGRMLDVRTTAERQKP